MYKCFKTDNSEWKGQIWQINNFLGIKNENDILSTYKDRHINLEGMKKQKEGNLCDKRTTVLQI